MRPNPLWELTLTRLRLFFREPSAVFWTFGFPLALSLALGVAFRNRPPEPVRIGVAGSPSSRLVQSLDSAEGLRVSHLPDEAAVTNALRRGYGSLRCGIALQVDCDHDATDIARD